MGGYLNEHEIDSAITSFNYPETTLLHTGARVLAALAAWANDNSDGWCSWPKPRRAAANLIDVIEDRRRELLRGHPVLDVTEADLNLLLKPIKAFLTRQSVDYHAELPWAALLPAT